MPYRDRAYPGKDPEFQRMCRGCYDAGTLDWVLPAAPIQELLGPVAVDETDASDGAM